MSRNGKKAKVNLINEYFKWLCDIVRVNQSESSYYFLVKDLFFTDFCWSIPNDDNRADDGRLLRTTFLDEMGYDYEDNIVRFDFGCNMLEMMIALAKRMNTLMDDLNNNDRTWEWFRVLLENTELEIFDDESYYDFGGREGVMRIVDVVLARSYKRNGKGGLFPLKRTKKDQRRVEIWYQMSEYLIENYY